MWKTVTFSIIKKRNVVLTFTIHINPFLSCKYYFEINDSSEVKITRGLYRIQCNSVNWGDSSISRMPGCGPNALSKNWIVSAVSSLYLNNVAS